MDVIEPPIYVCMCVCVCVKISEKVDKKKHWQRNQKWYFVFILNECVDQG